MIRRTIRAIRIGNRIAKRFYATKRGERPRSLAVWSVCHLTAHCRSGAAGRWRIATKSISFGRTGSSLGMCSPAFCGSGRGSCGSWAQWPLPEPSQPGSIGASASRHKARQAKLAEETMRWPGFVGSTGGGDADPDPTLACSRAAHRGGLDFPLRRLTTIPRRTLVAARHARQPDHDRRPDQPTEHCGAGAP